MAVFAFREELVAEYERFSRSFGKICGEGIAVTKECVHDEAAINRPARHSKDSPT